MTQYKAEDIQVLEGIEAVRKRPGMYIGSTGVDGLHHLIYEIVANSVDEAIGGYAKNIDVRLLKKGRVSVFDDGRGIPVDTHSKTKKSALETVLTILHAGGKFSQKAYKVSGGLHGVGLSVVNALSKNLRAIVYRDGFQWSQEYERGIAKEPIKQGKKSDTTGTEIIFDPDPQIFSEMDFDRKRILDYIRHQAFLTPGLRINFFDEREDEVWGYGFYFETGIQSFFNHLTVSRDMVLDPFVISFSDEKQSGEIVFGYLNSQENVEYAFTNNIHNPEGGMHIIGFKNGLLKIFNELQKNGNGKQKTNFTADDLKNGLVSIVSLRIPDPQFEGQTKGKLGNPEVRGFVENALYDYLHQYFGKNPDQAKKILSRIALNFEARLAAKSARDSVLKKRLSPSLTLSGKLSDCSSRNVKDRELFLVEGESAGGSMKQGRDRHFQAVLPLKGKILNVEKATLDKILKSEEVKNLIIAMGTNVGRDFDLEKLKYSKIVIAADADSDGNHIRTLLLTLFYRYLRPVIDDGFLYIAQPPLFRIKHAKEMAYAYSDQERDDILKKQFKGKNPDVQRYKGLGEMNPEELWETTLDPKKRIMFSVLMGNEVQPRKQFIETYAKEVQNLDI